MLDGLRIAVVIPARDESAVIGRVVGELLELRNERGSVLVDRIVVTDNGSTDATARLAALAGAEVVGEANPGYGYACLRALREIDDAEVVVFVDGDGSVVTDELPELLAPVLAGADLVIGTRVPSRMERDALTLPQRIGTALVSSLISRLWHCPVSDLGPFRAVRLAALNRLAMRDTRYGWTVEMQVKALQLGLATVEVPVSTRRRVGQSKISGTLRGVVGAGLGMLGMVAKLWWLERSRPSAYFASDPQPRIRSEPL